MKISDFPFHSIITRDGTSFGASHNSINQIYFSKVNKYTINFNLIYGYHS